MDDFYYEYVPQFGPLLHVSDFEVEPVTYWPGIDTGEPVELLKKWEVDSLGNENKYFFIGIPPSLFPIGPPIHQDFIAKREYANRSTDPDYFETVIQKKGWHSLFYWVPSESESMPESCWINLLVVESKSPDEECAPGFPEKSGGGSGDLSWCVCYDTCGTWVDGKLCEGWDVNTAMDRYELLHCGPEGQKNIRLPLENWDTRFVNEYLGIFHGVCIPPLLSEEDLDGTVIDPYDVEATVTVRQAEGSGGEELAVDSVQYSFSISNVSFHFFDDFTDEAFHDWIVDVMGVNSSYPTYESEWEVVIEVESTYGTKTHSESCQINVRYGEADDSSSAFFMEEMP